LSATTGQAWRTAAHTRQPMRSRARHRHIRIHAASRRERPERPPGHASFHRRGEWASGNVHAHGTKSNALSCGAPRSSSPPQRRACRRRQAPDSTAGGGEGRDEEGHAVVSECHTVTTSPRSAAVGGPSASSAS
jgi:hypothetical protein